MVTGKHTWSHMGLPMFADNYAKGVEKTWAARWTSTHVLMHAHILTKVWDQSRGNSNMHTGSHIFAHNYAEGVEQM